MTLAHNPRIVTDGLVLCLDAANPKSYSGSGTVWKDLSKNSNDGTLVNGVGFSSENNGAMVFDGVDDYVQFSPISVQTVCFWGRMDENIPNLAALVATSATGDGSLRTDPNGTFRNNPDGNDFHQNFVTSLMINGKSNLPFISRGLAIPNERTLFQDFYVGAIGNSRPISTISHLFAGRVYRGIVYFVCLYDRQLSNIELLQNYNALKGRYGL